VKQLAVGWKDGGKTGFDSYAFEWLFGYVFLARLNPCGWREVIKTFEHFGCVGLPTVV
jgi:hypothetical protein